MKDSSSSKAVISNIPQGTNFGSLLFFAFFSNLPESILSDTRIFEEYSHMYSHTGINENARQLQQNLLEKYSRTSMARTPLGP